MHQEDVMILSGGTPNDRASKPTREKLTELKAE